MGEPEQLVEAAEGYSFADVCALLGFDPLQVTALTLTTEKVIAVSTEFIEFEGENDGD